MIRFDLSFAMPNIENYGKPYAHTIVGCLARPYKKYVSRENEQGWRWNGPLIRTRRGYMPVVLMTEKLQEYVIGQLRAAGYLEKAEGYCKEYLDDRFRATEDDIQGVLLV